MLRRNGSMFSIFKTQNYKVTKSNGNSFDMQASNSDGGLKIFVEQSAITPNAIECGDIIETVLSNGVKETFEVIEPGYYDTDLFPAHYQIKVKRINNINARNSANMFPHSINNNGGMVVINQSSPNASININQCSKFDEIKQVIETCNEINNKEAILKILAEMQQLTNDKSSFAHKYNELVSALANHMTLLTPFITYLAKFLP